MTPREAARLRAGARRRARHVLGPWPVLADRLVVTLDDLPLDTLAFAVYIGAGGRASADRGLMPPRRKKPLPPLVAQIMLNREWWRGAGRADRRETIVHEAAHLLAEHFQGQGVGRAIRPHGPEWRAWTKRLCGRELSAT